ncbi:Binding-protein-dependent transport systems inner membrane component [Nostocoides australiense Ben110]|uniref:Binding-protein-dependent transport systems inner membrane component n=1 Tax=Nostocoides australiense Ben110 TaxID=1193182 RepID=W6K127_9MICO|nr:sugar ABC transporter permease [Tetrasphaera australiensis]CCH74725.1 Binding-protein-dependent transport systems inner membrane component [Tetrasphaera australiensis Ben110]
MTTTPANVEVSAAAAAPTRPPLGARLRGRQNQNLWFWVFVGPFVLGLIIFIYIPILWSIYLSFFESYNTVTPTKFVGIGNYLDMLKDESFRSSLGTFIVFALFIVPTTFALSLLTAILVARTRVMQAFFRSVFFLPTACSYVVAALIWKMSIFSGVRSGAANALLGLIGLDSIPWLSVTKPPWYWLVIVSARLWLQVGFYMILFLAALQRISPTLYEAAAIDGASAWQSFRYITLPQLRPTSAAVLLLLLINAFQAFDEFYNILSSFGTYPPYARPPLVYLYYVALGQGQDFGHGSAGAVILTLVILIAALVFNRFFSFRGDD